MNRRLIAFFLVLLIGACVFADAKLTAVADRIYAYIDVSDPTPATGYGVNVGVVVGDDAVLVIDTLISAKGARKLLADIRAVSDKPIRWVVNTHYHGDHTLGNCVFAKIGACIVAQDECLTNMKAKAQMSLDSLKKSNMLAAEDIEGTEIAYPTLTFSKSMTIDLGGITVELRYPGPSHSADSCIVYLPAQKVLFMGDILFTNYHPYMGESDVPGWMAVLDEIGRIDAERIIPGHGPVSGKKDLADMKTYLELFDKYAKKLVKSADKPVDAAAVAKQLKSKLPQRQYLDLMIAVNLQQKYISQGTSDSGTR